MRIDRARAERGFLEYVRDYDAKDEKVRLKIEHTLRVAQLCDRIAGACGLVGEERDLVWLAGLLHDVGRFEQLRNFGTFIDAESIDHAVYGAQILFEDGKVRDYVTDESEDAILWNAVNWHSAYRIPEDLDERTRMVCQILRDADKIDILKVNVEFPLEEIYNVSTQELLSAAVTPEVLEAFYEEHAVLRSLKKTVADHIVGHISLIFELVYPESRKVVREQGFLDVLLNFRSENPETNAAFAKIREHMHRFLGRGEKSKGVSGSCLDQVESVELRYLQENKNLAQEILNKLCAYVRENQINVYDIAIMTESGSASAFCQPCNPCNDSYSVTKLFVATMIGILAEQGKLSLDDKLTELLREDLTFSFDERWNAVTVRHALTHKMGLDYGVMDVDRDDTTEYASEDFLKLIMDYPPVQEPGQEWVYTDVAHYLLSRVITRITGLAADEAINQAILRPLRFQPTVWQRCPYNYTIGSSGAFMRASDMVKLGWLYQNDGEYQGKRIVSQEWIRLAEEEQYDLYPVEQTGFIGKGGMCGQMLLYHRAAGVSAAWHGYDDVGDSINGNLIPYLEQLLAGKDLL